MNEKGQWNWQMAHIKGKCLEFENKDGFDNALKDGFFFLKHDKDFDLAAGDKFAKNFFLPKTPNKDCNSNNYKGFQHWSEESLGKHLGYFCRNVDQTEQFFLEKKYWDKIFPKELALQAEAMKQLAIDVLKAILNHLDIPKKIWDKATGYSLSPSGTHTLTFNHFRSNIQARGLNIHKDSGWVTLLRSEEPGLEVKHGEVWYPINPIKGAFIVNFGCAMEILTQHTSTPVFAVSHRVVQQKKIECKEDRCSYALFIDSSLDQSVSRGLYQYEPGKGLALKYEFAEFLDKILDNTYKVDTQGLY